MYCTLCMPCILQIHVFTYSRIHKRVYGEIKISFSFSFSGMRSIFCTTIALQNTSSLHFDNEMRKT